MGLRIANPEVLIKKKYTDYFAKKFDIKVAHLSGTTIVSHFTTHPRKVHESYRKDICVQLHTQGHKEDRTFLPITELDTIFGSLHTRGLLYRPIKRKKGRRKEKKEKVSNTPHSKKTFLFISRI